MDFLQGLQEFLVGQTIQVSPVTFTINLLLAAVLSFILSIIYTRFGTSLSNRRKFARNFIILTMTTTMIITIIKFSLALSLGLVGALSIVRFRAAIKEPEELAYLFLSIGIGVGLGADQKIITTIGFLMSIAVIFIISMQKRAEETQNLHLNITSHTGPNPDKVDLGDILKVLKKYCTAVDLRRFDETEELIDASFSIEIDNFEKLNEAKAELRKLSKSIQITFLDNKGVG